MKIIIKTEGGRGVGFGHVTRCLALAQAFQEAGVTPSVWLRGDESLGAFFPGIPVRIDSFSSSSSFWSDIKNADVVVVDWYLDGPAEYDAIAAAAKTVVCLDDANRLPYPKGFVLNGGANAEKLNYPRSAGWEYLLGSSYALLRKRF